MLRPRREEDLERCVVLLREVYEADRYPAIWPPDAVGWLAGRDPLLAWVAEEREQLLGHLSLQAHNRDAIAFYERRGWQRVGTTELSLSGEPWTLPVALFVLP
jgi:hypothetical protein